MVQWLGLRASTAGGVGLIPGQGTKIMHVVWQKKKKKSSHHKERKKKRIPPVCFVMGGIENSHEVGLNLSWSVSPLSQNAPSLSVSLAFSLSLSFLPSPSMSNVANDGELGGCRGEERRRWEFSNDLL